MYMKKCHSDSPSLVDGIHLLILDNVLGALGVFGALGVEFLFCNVEGNVGMASTVLVA